MKALPIIILLSAAVDAMAENPPASAPGEAPEQGLKMPATRFIGGGEGLDAHVLNLRQRLAINRQERGPFGLYQTPGKAPIIKSPIAKMIEKTPFSDYIDQIDISVVNAKDKEFFVKARIFRLGQEFPIVRGGERLTVRVESIEPSRVSFKNLKNGEVATKSLDVLPAGVMTAGTDLKVRGVTPAGRGEAQPLHLDFTPPPPTP